jgi:hypothetical protein
MTIAAEASIFCPNLWPRYRTTNSEVTNAQKGQL